MVTAHADPDLSAPLVSTGGSWGGQGMRSYRDRVMRCRESLEDGDKEWELEIGEQEQEWGENQRGQSRDGRQMWRQDRYPEWETKTMGDWEAEREGRVENRKRPGDR